MAGTLVAGCLSGGGACWAVGATAGALLYLLIVAVERQDRKLARRRREGRCRRCGYDLRGQPAAGRCPECGGLTGPPSAR